MLKNYERLENGTIRQIKYIQYQYEDEYFNKYKKISHLNNNMANLRLGLIIGAIKRVPSSILDIGAGTGEFINTCSDIVPKCFAFDVIKTTKYSKKVQRVENFLKEQYDVITFFDSLEHIEDISFIKKLKCNYVVISVPWCHYFSDEWFESWKHRRENEHLWHFNEESLKNFFKENGYRAIFSGNPEDTIRKPVDDNKNILTCIFEKIDE